MEREGMNFKQVYNYLVKWRAKTGMEGFCEGNLVWDFDSLADYAHEECKYL